MFKKRFTKKKPDSDDDHPTSPTITVSVPQDALGILSPTTSLTSISSRSSTANDTVKETWSHTDYRPVQPHQPWKPWDPQKLGRTSQSGPTFSSPPIASGTTFFSTTGSTKVSPRPMLHLSNVASGSNSSGVAVNSGTGSTPNTPNSTASRHRQQQQQQQQQQQPVEAQLWNADLTATSPLSPARPRYIPAIAGSGAYPRASPRPGTSITSAQTNRLYEGARKTRTGFGNAAHEDGTATLGLPDTYSPSIRRNNNLEVRKKDQHHSQQDHLEPGYRQNQRYPLILTDPKRVVKARLFCLRQNRRLHPCVRLVVLLFLAGSVCYTTLHLIFRDSNSKDRLRKSMEYTEQQLKIRRILGQSATKKRVVSAFDVDAQQYNIHQWELETFDINNSKAIVHINEDYMLSKAFSGAMQPTRVIPFYFRASFMDEDEDEDNDYREGDEDGPSGSQNAKTPPFAELPPVNVDPSLVTITTLITPDRYGVFLKLVKQYRGPISVATHIKKGEDQDRLFHELNAFFQKHAILRKYVDLHVIVDGVDLQLNMWRNIARMFARTDYFMMLDVDFHIPSSLKNNLHRDPRIRELLSSGAALVIPAFEYSLEHDPKDSRYFPDTKADLIPLLEKNHIRVFHDSFPPGHAATDTARWIKMSKRSSETEEHRWGSISPPRGRAGFDGDYDMSNRIQEDEDEDDDARFLAEGVGPITEEEKEAYLELEASGERPYKITAFEPKYEPYIVLKREGTHWCDERFVGYGANKAACLFEIYISGIDFWVMPQDFLIHQYHDYPTTNRKNGRILNKQLFVHFQQEICYGTLQRMIATGEWYTTKADNLRHQCSAFDNFLKSADELAQEYESQHPGSLLEEAVFVADLSERKTEERSRLAHSLNKPNQSQDQDENERLNDDRSGDRYDSRGHGKAALGEQIVDDEEHQDPFMSRPKGKVWGGIQPKTYYVPPPPMDEDGIPIDGIDIDAMLEGSVNVGADEAQVRHDVAAEEGGSWHKQDGSVLEEGVGSKDMGHEGGQTGQWLDKDAYRFQAGGSEHSTDSFEDAAEKLEGTFRVIGAST